MSDLALAIKLTTEGGQIVVQELTQIGQAAGTTNKELVNTGTAGTAAKKGFDDASSGATALNGYMNTLKTTAGLVIGSFSAMKLIDTADDWGQMASRIRQATESSEEYTYVQQRMVESANDTYRSITETRESFVMMSPILRDMNYNLGQSIDIVDSFSSLLVTNAANADRASGAQAALAKSIQAGKIDADAWQTIFGVMPSILDNITAATGKTGTEIRQLGVTGKLSITELTNALLLSYDANRQAVESMPTTVRDAMQSFSNVFSNYIGWQNEARGVTADVASGIEFLADNFDTLVSIVGGAAIGALTAYTVRTGVATLATVKSYQAKQVATLQELRLAQAQIAQTKATLAQVTANATYAAGSARVTAATAAHETATKRLTLAQQAHVSIGRSLLGVLGGPVGIAITAGIAAASFIDFGSSASSAKEEAKRLKDEARSLVGAIEDLNKVQAAPQLISAEEKLATSKAAKTLLENEKALLESRQKLHEAWSKNIDARSEKEQQKYAGAVKKNTDQLNVNAAALQKSSIEIEKYEKRVSALQAVLNGTAGAEAKPNLPTEDNKELEKALLGVYNAQLLNATAVDAYGASLDGIDLELFKAEFVAATKLPEDAAEAIRLFAEQAKTAQENLQSSAYNEELQAQIALLDLRLAKGEQEYEIQKALAQFTGADPARLSALQAELALMQKKQALVADKATLASLQKETELLKVRLNQGKAEYEIQKALAKLKGADAGVIAAIEAEIRVQAELSEQIATTEDIASGAFSKMLDDMSALSSAGNSFGDAVTQAFGRVAQQIDGMTAAQVSYNNQLDELKKKRAEIEKLEANSPERAKGLLELQRKEASLQRDNYQAQIGQFSALAGAAKSMFGEQSKEREKLHRLETAFAAVEMAMAMQKAAANALTAITNQGSGDPYSAFARIAAMAALMAGLGVFSGSVSGNPNIAADRQASQGTGTLLGSDEKSASIANSLERIESLELDQYVELREINANIKSLSAGIANLAVSLVGNFGKFNEQNYEGKLGTEKQFQLGSGLASFVSGGLAGLGLDKLLDGMLGGIFNSVLGGISKTTKKLLDSGISFKAQELGDILATGLVEGSYYNVVETTKRKLWGLSKKTKQSTEYADLDNALEAEFGRIFASIGNSVTDAVQLLGLDTSELLENFVIDLPALSFKDLSGDEIQAELEAIFSAQADLMVQYLVPAIGEYQQMGEGLYETLIRVAQEQAVFNAQLDALGLSLGDLSAALRIDVAQSIIELMGGIEEFRDLTSQYFASFYSETEQFDYLSKTVAQAFASMGLAVPGAREEFKELVDSLDLTTEAGQKLFAQLIQLVPGLDQYFKAMDKQAEAAEKAAEAEQKLAEQRAGFSDNFKKELQRMDMTALQRSLDDLQGWYDEQMAIAEELGAETVFLERLYARKRQNVIDQELEQLAASTETAIANLTKDSEAAIAELVAAHEQLVSSIQAVSAGIGNAILDIKRNMAGWDEAGYQSGQVTALRGQLGSGDIASQVKTVEQLQAAIVNRYSAEQSAINALAAEQQAVVDALKSSYEQLVSSIQSASSSIASSILDIQRQSAGWNEVGYQTGQVNDLRSQLGLGSTADQVNTITQLQQAITGRYQAEVAANKQLQDAANQRYQTELAASQAMRQAAKQLLQAADAMLLSDASPELLGKQLTEAKSQFDTLLAAARGGDADAARQLQQVGGSYLNIAKDYYAQGSDEYADIFNEIQGAYRGIGASAPGEPAVPAAVREYQQKDAQLQQAAIDELTGLQTLLDELEQKVAAEQAQQLADAEAALAKYQADSLALQQSTIDELTGLQDLLAELELQALTELNVATATLQAELAAQTAALVAAHQQQIDAISQTALAIVDAIKTINTKPIYTLVPEDPIDTIGPVIPPVVVQSQPVVTTPGGEPNEQLIAELRRQREESQQHNQNLIKEVGRLRSELGKTQTMVYDLRRQA